MGMVDNVNIMREKVDKVNQLVPKASEPHGPMRHGPAGVGRRGGPRAAAAGPDIAELLHALTHRMKRHLHHSVRALPEAPAPMEWRALGFFARHPGASARDLVAHAGRDKAQVARLVRALVERGLLAATPSPSDMRSQCLSLTEAGLAVHRQLAQARRRIDAALIAGLNAAEQSQLAALLARLHDSLGEP